jgi:quercetin dioxygenase-like cupin family protein
MTYMHMSAGPDGESHLESVQIDFSSPDTAGRVFPADHVRFNCLPAGSFVDWHRGPRTQFIVTLAGGAEVIASDGTRSTAAPGSATLVADTTGKGHQTIMHDAEDRIVMAVGVRLDGSPPPPAAATGPSSPPREVPPLKIPRLHTTPDGGTAFDEIEIDFSGAAPSQWHSLRATSVTFNRLPAGFFADWHTEARRQFVITLSGEADIVTTDGARRRSGPGTVILVEDLEGKGHQTIVPDSADRIIMLVALADDAG